MSRSEQIIKTNSEKYGSYENWVLHMRIIAKKGGSTKTDVPRGFAAMPKSKVRATGRKGGKKSRPSEHS